MSQPDRNPGRPARHRLRLRGVFVLIAVSVVAFARSLARARLAPA